MTPHAVLLRGFEILKRLPDRPVVGAEIGVWRGYLSHTLLTKTDLVLFMVDSWLGIEGFGEKYSPKVQIECKEATVANTAWAGRRAQIIHLSSEEAAKTMRDAVLDFVFIDADHSYNGCKTDIEYWLPKIKVGLSGATTMTIQTTTSAKRLREP